MASRIGKHIEGLALVLRAVVQHPSTQLLGTLAMPLQVLESVSARRAMTASPGGRSPSSYSFRLMPASRARARLGQPSTFARMAEPGRVEAHERARVLSPLHGDVEHRAVALPRAEDRLGLSVHRRQEDARRPTVDVTAGVHCRRYGQLC